MLIPVSKTYFVQEYSNSYTFAQTNMFYQTYDDGV